MATDAHDVRGRFPSEGLKLYRFASSRREPDDERRGTSTSNRRRISRRRSKGTSQRRVLLAARVARTHVTRLHVGTTACRRRIHRRRENEDLLHFVGSQPVVPRIELVPAV